MIDTKSKQVALYARVSTLDKGQDPETQLLQLREYADRRGLDVAGEYVDYATGTNEDRANYQRLLDDARKPLSTPETLKGGLAITKSKSRRKLGGIYFNSIP